MLASISHACIVIYDLPQACINSHTLHTMSVQSLQKNLFTLHDVACLMGFHVRTISRMVDNRELKAVRIRNRWMVCRHDLESYISEQRTNLN